MVAVLVHGIAGHDRTYIYEACISAFPSQHIIKIHKLAYGATIFRHFEPPFMDPAPPGRT